MTNVKEYTPIEDYGVIGNLNTTALVSISGSIDFLPFTRFDSPTIFGALLDVEHGGSFSIDVLDVEVNHRQLYLPDTAVLLTRYLTSDGIAELTDFMPLTEKEDNLVLVRKLKIIKGKHTFRIEIKPRSDYGKYDYTLKKEEGNFVLYDKGPLKNSFRIFSDLDFDFDDGCLYAEISMETKDELSIAMVAINESEDNLPLGNLKYYTKKCFADTVLFWRNWIDKSNYSGRWQDVVNRSAITLKLLTSYRYGSTVAAATLGLPERIGGERNWDYRYTWIRDAAFSMYSFLQLGFTSEAAHFIEWIKQRIQETDAAGDLKLMYRIDGSTDLQETTLPFLEGYKKSTPVRTGNGAFNQFQLDIYGELIDTIYIYNKNALPISYDFWLNLVKYVDFVNDNWREKDHGIWEVRDDKREFPISKVMSWVALDRAILIAENRSFPAPLEKWRSTRNEIFNDVFYNYWNPELNAFVQYRGANTLDASAMLIPLVRMLSPTEPRLISTIKAIEKDLITDSLVYRYKLDKGATDGFSEEEGTFSVCSFWYIECLAKMGEPDKAILYFEKMLGYANHLGLFSEQISFKGEQLGNFPQAFTHLGLISAAHQLRLLLAQKIR